MCHTKHCKFQVFTLEVQILANYCCASRILYPPYFYCRQTIVMTYHYFIPFSFDLMGRETLVAMSSLFETIVFGLYQYELYYLKIS